MATPARDPFPRAAFLSAALVAAGATPAAERFLTVGGGYAPSGNQVSLESNVHYFRKVLSGLGLGERPHDVFFADGASPDPDLQYLADETAPEGGPTPPVNLLLADVFASGKDKDGAADLRFRYRTSRIDGVAGRADVATLDNWFEKTGRALGAPAAAAATGAVPGQAPGDRLLFYFTGHGGGSKDKNRPADSRLYLWENGSLGVAELASRLDKLPPAVPVVLVMVQCHGGGFANLIFKDGNPARGLSDHDRCGCFATTSDRIAAGCTPDVNQANYREYSSYFWAALCGVDRTGAKVEPRPDYDGDGRVGFAEAHAYALIHSDSIDVSVKTSGVLLRHLCKTAPKPARPAPAGANATGAGAEAPRPLDLMTADTSYARLHAVAGLAGRAVLDGLSAQLQLSGEDRTKGVRSVLAIVEADRRRVEGEKKGLEQRRKKLRDGIAFALKSHWPELGHPWHPGAARAVNDEAGEILKAAESHPHYGEFSDLARRLDALESQDLELERKWAKCQRFLHAAESAALAHNLPQLVAQDKQDRYTKLLAAESATLAGPGR